MPCSSQVTHVVWYNGMSIFTCYSNEWVIKILNWKPKLKSNSNRPFPSAVSFNTFIIYNAYLHQISYCHRIINSASNCCNNTLYMYFESQSPYHCPHIIIEIASLKILWLPSMSVKFGRVSTRRHVFSFGINDCKLSIFCLDVQLLFRPIEASSLEKSDDEMN